MEFQHFLLMSSPRKTSFMSDPRPRAIASLPELRAAIAALRRAGKRIGFVPTMGALHEGHLSLVRASKAECAATAVSIYVNPRQFGPNEDFSKYPRTLEADLELLAGCGADLVFTPQDADVYPPGFASWVEVGAVAEPLEGQFRPGHFRGVATVSEDDAFDVAHLLAARQSAVGDGDVAPHLDQRGDEAGTRRIEHHILDGHVRALGERGRNPTRRRLPRLPRTPRGSARDSTGSS